MYVEMEDIYEKERRNSKGSVRHAGRATGNKNAELKHYLQIKLSVLYNILSEDVPEEYWEQIEKWTI